MIRTPRPGARLGGAMYGAGPRGHGRPRAAGGFPASWSFLQGRMDGGAVPLPPGVRVPMQGDTRPPPAPTPLASQPTPGVAIGSPAAGPAAPGGGIPAGMPAPDAPMPQRPTGGPLTAAVLGPTSSPQDYLGRAGWRPGL